tara:strand:- start:490 stop:1857 length:1368 start_codon:yes stop_codon:yes gene_type:complete
MFQNCSFLPAALESPIGCQLDLSKNLEISAELITPAANRDFSSDTGYWTKQNAGITISGGTCNFIAVPAGFALSQASFATAGLVYDITFTISAISGGAIRAIAGSALTTTTAYSVAGTYTQRLCTVAGSNFGISSATSATTATITSISIKQVLGNHRFQSTDANRPILSARYNLLLATATLSTQNITTVATSYTIYFTGTGTVTLSGTFVGVFSAGTNTFTATAGTLTATVVGSVLTADIRPTNQTTTLPAYQAVVTSSSYDTVGFPQYLKYNGSNSSLSTASINFTATAQMSAFAGVRKIGANAATSIGMVAELSNQCGVNAGSFLLSEGGVISYGNKYGCALQGSTLIYSDSATSWTPPITNTLSTLMNISAATPALQQILNINGVQQSVTQAGSSAGTGNFGNYAMYFGARAGTSLFTNGYEFQTIIVGKTLTATEIANTESFVNSKTKAYA